MLGIYQSETKEYESNNFQLVYFTNRNESIFLKTLLIVRTHIVKSSS